MQINNRKYIVVIIALVVVFAFVLKIELGGRKILSEIDLDKIPLELSGWEGRDIELPQSVYEILETKDVLSRRYEDKEGGVLDLSIVYSGHDRQSFHPPEVCYLGGGIELIAKSKENIPLEGGAGLKTNKLIMKSSGGTIKAWYWFLVGDRFVDNFYQQQLYFILDALGGRKLQGALIKVSIRGDSEILESKLKFFIAKITPHLARTF